MQTNDHVLNSAPVDSYGASISRFMNWAAERIAKEVEENERVEAQAGTREFIPGSGDAKKQDYTLKEKLDIVNNVNRLRGEGMTCIAACDEYGIHNSTYYQWKRALNK